MYDKKPKFLFIDIETSPLLGYAWGFYEQNILKIIEHTKILSVGYKWLDDKKASVKALPDFPGYKAGVVDDRKLVEFIWKLLDEADVVCAHHGDPFDVKKINARFAYHKLNPPSWYKTIDTKKVASRYFRFDSNKLEELGNFLGEGHKIKHEGFIMWDGCMKGDPNWWKKMITYNAQDVMLLERIYMRLRPYMEGHPNLNVIANPEAKDLLTCPTCLSDDIQKRGWSITRTGRKQRYQCNDCGSWSSGPHKKANVVLR